METWVEADIEGYMVSSEGRLAKLMALTPSKNGYVQLGVPEFSGAKKRIRRYLHDLVLTAFAGPRPAGAVARHLNDISTTSARTIASRTSSGVREVKTSGMPSGTASDRTKTNALTGIHSRPRTCGMMAATAAWPATGRVLALDTTAFL